MKRHLLSLIAVATLPFFYVAQTKTISFQEIVAGKGVFFGAEMDQGTSTITMTIAGPDDRWFGVGFGSSMGNADVLMYTDGKSGAMHTEEPTDYRLTSQSVGGVTKDAQQDWTIVSNTTSAGVRTIVATRLFSTGDANDIAVSFSDVSLNVIWAKHSTASMTLNYHGSTNRGVKQFTWTDNSASIAEIENYFEISQSPGKLQIRDLKGQAYGVEVIGMNGSVIFAKDQLSGDQEIILDDSISSGSYVVMINGDKGVASKVIRL